MDALVDRNAGNTRARPTRTRDKTQVVTYRVPHNAAIQIYDYKQKRSRYAREKRYGGLKKEHDGLEKRLGKEHDGLGHPAPTLTRLPSSAPLPTAVIRLHPHPYPLPLSAFIRGLTHRPAPPPSPAALIGVVYPCVASSLARTW